MLSSGGDNVCCDTHHIANALKIKKNKKKKEKATLF